MHDFHLGSLAAAQLVLHPTIYIFILVEHKKNSVNLV